MTTPIEHGSSRPVCLSVCVQRAAPRTSPPFGRTLSFPESASRLFEVRTPAPKQVWVPFHRSTPVAEGGDGAAHPPGKRVPQTADKPDETELNTPCSTKSSSSAASDRTQKPKPPRTTASTLSSTSLPRRAGRTTRANTRPAPNGTASTPGRDLSKFARTLQKGQLITLEGTLRYREVETEGQPKQRLAEIHATSMKRLSKIEAADDPHDGAGED